MLLAGPTQVRDLFVEGKQVVSMGQVQTIDMEATTREANRLARGLAESL